MRRLALRLRAERGARWCLGLALAGAGLIAWPAWSYRVDRVTCAAWPPLGRGVASGALFTLGVALLTLAWLGLQEHLGGDTGLMPRGEPVEPARPLSLGAVMGLGLLVHAVAIVSPVFLIADPLLYAAVGRAMAFFGASAYTPMSQALPHSDPLFLALPPDWLDGTSAYSAGWNAVTQALAHAGGSPSWQLRLYQLLALASVTATAWIVAATARRASDLGWRWRSDGQHADADRAAARAAALVLWSPLGIIEGTINAHNDAFLMVAVALFAWAVSRQRTVAALAMLAAAVLIKISALVLAAHYVTSLLARLWRAIARERRVWVALGLGAAAIGVGALVWIELPALRRSSMTVARLFDIAGAGSIGQLFCTRAVECLPRAFLYYVLDAHAASTWVGFAFRVLGAVFILWSGWRAGGTRILGASAAALFVFFLLLQGFSQTWYLLLLLPLVPHALFRLQPAMLVFLSLPLAYYALEFPTACSLSVVETGVVEVAEAALMVLPALIVWLRWRRR